MARRSSVHGPHPVDVYVGQRMNQRRQILGLSQEKLAKLTQVTFQQIQKRTTGKNRMGASTLYITAQALGVPVSYFFEGLDQPGGANIDVELATRRSFEIIKALDSLEPEVSQHIVRLIRKLAGEPDKAAA